MCHKVVMHALPLAELGICTGPEWSDENQLILKLDTRFWVCNLNHDCALRSTSQGHAGV